MINLNYNGLTYRIDMYLSFTNNVPQEKLIKKL